VHLDDVRMAERADQLRLPFQPLQLTLATDSQRKQLDGDAPLEPLVAREQDLTHAAAAQLALDDIAARKNEWEYIDGERAFLWDP